MPEVPSFEKKSDLRKQTSGEREEEKRKHGIRHQQRTQLTTSFGFRTRTQREAVVDQISSLAFLLCSPKTL